MLEQEQGQKSVVHYNLEDPEAQTTISLPPSRRGRYRCFALKDNPERLAEVLEEEGRHFFSQSGYLSPTRIKALDLPGGTAFIARVYRYYPGGIRALRRKVEQDTTPHWQAGVSAEGLPIDKRGRVLWSELARDQERLVATLKSEVGGLVTSHGKNTVTKQFLAEQGRSDLLNAVRNHYPGGFIQLRLDIGDQPSQRPAGYWTTERIREEALQFYQAARNLSGYLLVQSQRIDLSIAINRRYPGGIRQLKADLGIESTQKPSGYWTPEAIEKEAREFYEQYGHFSRPILEQKDRMDLGVAIKLKYPGGMDGLRIKLGWDIPAKHGYWTPEVIEQEAEKFYQSYGRISQKLLCSNNRADLASAIVKKYPGGWLPLRGKLGFKPTQVPKGYWIPENIEREALIFYSQHGDLTQKSLVENSKSGLAFAISNKYPGGLVVLRGKLGIDSDQQEIKITSEEANEQLRKLLEDRI